MKHTPRSPGLKAADAGGGPRAGGYRRIPQLGAARTPPPPFTQRGPGTPLPACAAEAAKACGLRFCHCRRAGLCTGPPAGDVRPVIGERGARYPPDPHPPQTGSPGYRLPQLPPPSDLLPPSMPKPPLTLLSAPARPPKRLSGQGHGHRLAPLSHHRPSASVSR